MGKRMQSRAEEFANSASHVLGLLAALSGTPFLIAAMAGEGSIANVAGVSVFAASMVLLYLSSALYHGAAQGPRKSFFHKLDHAAIYVLIAGTYTPFTLGVLGGVWGWTLFGLIWAMASIGLLLKAFGGLSNRFASIGLYLLMGWLIVVAAVPLIEKVPMAGLLWLVAGGLAYTGGVIFYALSSRLRFGHFIWHLFVMAGTTCHFFAVLWYSA
ncbi:hemolysin III family protein [Uliginosibacterium sp. H3]|uniref:Hemolysin III family protein n=1 Tax=Uliginosibacterium silvisoli TaxID=3114758 RepID=A0ABU6K267_9RHOO|nr:hemolysin III family protein [Uliginosibacterium sp. H3]